MPDVSDSFKLLWTSLAVFSRAQALLTSLLLHWQPAVWDSPEASAAPQQEEDTVWERKSRSALSLRAMSNTKI